MDEIAKREISVNCNEVRIPRRLHSRMKRSLTAAVIFASTCFLVRLSLSNSMNMASDST